MIKCADRIGIWSVVFCGGRKTGEPGEKASEQDENQQQTQLTYAHPTVRIHWHQPIRRRGAMQSA